MDKIKLKNWIDQGLSLRQITNLSNKSLTTIRYWIKKHNLSSQHKSFKNQGLIEYGETRFCSKCKNHVKTEEFYQRRGKPNASVYCKKCTNIQTVERQKEFKRKCWEYKGKQCQNPNCPAPIRDLKSYDFHHLDPKQKSFEISKVRSLRFDERVIEELDKCLMLCACCHREI
jgi:hypothetical protein